MCGVAGFWDFKKRYNKKTLFQIVQMMTDTLLSRGPNARGDWIHQNLGLAIGHRRLSIIDLTSRGAQPMVSCSKRSVVCYNGEIYNYKELKVELRQHGINFMGASDTEVLVEACELWGVEKTLNKLNGMFSFVFMDLIAEKLFLCRDRVGIKPLYWGFQGDCLYFASQPKALLRHPDFTAEIDRRSVEAYFRYNYIPSPDSIFKRVQKVKPGSFICIDSNMKIFEKLYWTPISYGEVSKLGVDDSIERLEALLSDSVKKRMCSDVPVGAFLSGGIDSSLIAALMQAQSTQPIKTFSVGFHQQGYNEANYAKVIAHHIGAEHYDHYFSKRDVAEIVPQLPCFYDEPFADSSQLPVCLVSKLTKQQQVGVALSGDGGDELFAGYNRYKAVNYWQFFNNFPLSVSLSRVISSISESCWDSIGNSFLMGKQPAHFGLKMHKMARVMTEDPQGFYENLVTCWKNNELLQNPIGYKSPYIDLIKEDTFVRSMQLVDILTYLPDDILTKVDRASMGFSLEARVPLLDHRVIEFALQLGLKHKIKKSVGKSILREILAHYVPIKLFDRPKMGFSIPIGNWLKTDLRGWAEDLLSDDKLKEDEILNLNVIKKKWEEHVSGKCNNQYQLWSILMFQSWRNYWSL